MTAEEYTLENIEEEWGDPLPSSSTRKLNKMISVRFRGPEAEQVKQAAERAGLTLSEFVRRAALVEAQLSQTSETASGSGPARAIRAVDSRSTFTTSADVGPLEPVLTAMD
jgi:hypothetical protein